MKSICNKIKSLAALICLAGMTSGMLFTFQSCKEDLSEGDYAIAEKPTITDYSAEASQFTKFKAILDRVTSDTKRGRRRSPPCSPHAETTPSSHPTTTPSTSISLKWEWHP